ncbi:universal stress protein [Sneathiella sp. HT1-7]|jgi:nucleotide-binding universal stress UspA family protein|uniref:universal stress protein n=1 Tax=Sneathiella sp. HT1-7 TaxID=2887192 RepID=UPI001D15D8D8|nr:universal stress protein [Sneathiella sp. HT1-7]MCC3304509.1 universal stress protein [Sneathiella sp. HT1-7]
MSIKTILLHLSNDSRLEARIETALGLAVEHDAYVIGLYTIAQVTVPTSFMGYVPPEFIEQSRKVEEENAAEAKAKFESLAAKVSRPVEVVVEEGYAPDLINEHALSADLVIVGQGDPDDENNAQTRYIAEEIVVSSPRPVLIIPSAGNYSNFGSHVIVGWNNTRESSRALHESLPFLKKAEKVTLLRVNATEDETYETEHILAHLKRHGITANFKSGHWPGISVGDAILDALVDYSGNMLVLGAYGHSRLREMILGGATKNILEHMTAPVLFAH